VIYRSFISCGGAERSIIMPLPQDQLLAQIWEIIHNFIPHLGWKSAKIMVHTWATNDEVMIQ
jgi:hypothetical protein